MFVLIILLNCFIVSRLWRLFQYEDILAVTYAQDEVPETALAQLVRENKSDKRFSEAVLWKYKGRTAVRTDGTDREQTVSVYQMKGQQGAVFGRGLCAGRYFTEGETSACLLDRETVRTLFGSENVLGMKVGWEDTELEITGILGGDQPLCIMPGNGETDYDGIAVKKTERASSSETAFGVLEASLGVVGQQKIDGHLYYMTACLSYFLLLALLLLSGRRRAKKKITVVLFSLLAAEVLILGINIASPGGDYLPSYWSDFDFFVQLFTEKKRQVQGLWSHQEFISWQRMLRMWQQVFMAETVMGLLMCIACIRMKGSRNIRH